MATIIKLEPDAEMQKSTHCTIAKTFMIQTPVGAGSRSSMKRRLWSRRTNWPARHGISPCGYRCVAWLSHRLLVCGQSPHAVRCLLRSAVQ